MVPPLIRDFCGHRLPGKAECDFVLSPFINDGTANAAGDGGSNKKKIKGNCQDTAKPEKRTSRTHKKPNKRASKKHPVYVGGIFLD